MNAPKTYGSKTRALLREAAGKYLEIGGFPEVQETNRYFRIQILQGYVDSVLLKDIIERHKVGKRDGFEIHGPAPYEFIRREIQY